MEIRLRRKEEVWRNRGRPKTEIPQDIMDLLLQTYGTGEVGQIDMTSPDYDPEETAELLQMLVLGAKRHPGRRLRYQVNETKQVILFEMVDIRRRRKKGQPQ